MSIEDKYLNEKDNFDFEGYFNDMLSNQKHSTKIKKYPELIKIAQDMWYDITKEINKRVKNVKSDMPYKAQYVLEELIKRLQKSV